MTRCLGADPAPGARTPTCRLQTTEAGKIAPQKDENLKLIHFLHVLTVKIKPRTRGPAARAVMRTTVEECPCDAVETTPNLTTISQIHLKTAHVAFATRPWPRGSQGTSASLQSRRVPYYIYAPKRSCGSGARAGVSRRQALHMACIEVTINL